MGKIFLLCLRSWLKTGLISTFKELKLLYSEFPARHSARCHKTDVILTAHLIPPDGKRVALIELAFSLESCALVFTIFR